MKMIFRLRGATTASIALNLLYICFFGANCQFVWSQSTLSNVAASLNGSFQVNANGGADYSIQVNVPPGTNDMAPQLSIIYNSQSGNGLLGKGFSLSGISSINRSSATIEQDGFKGGINYDDNDRFSLGSSRLILIGGDNQDYGADGTVYHTQLESWTKVTAHGACGGGPCSFSVVDKSGKQYEFGGTTDAQAPATGPLFNSGSRQNVVRKWYINQETDLNGNSITYSYTQSPVTFSGTTVAGASGKGQTYPDRIFYTSNSKNQAPAKRMVRFFYEARADTAAMYMGGGIIQTMARLARIRTYLIDENQDTVLVNDYALSYDSNAPLGISRIIGIAELSAQAQLYAADSLKWTNGPDTIQQQGFGYHGLFESGWQGDFDGDGKTDLLPVQNMIDTIYFARNGGFASVALDTFIELNIFTFVADFNGDGKTDVLNASNVAGTIHLATGQGFTAMPITAENILWPNTDNGSTCNCIWAADFNGDGLTDILTNSGPTAYLSFSTGSNFKYYQSFSFPSLEFGKNLVSDFNGDGLADIYAMGVDSIYLSNWSAGNSFLAGISPNTGVNSNAPSFFADFNGDNLADLIINDGNTYNICYSNGRGVESAQPVNTTGLGSSNNWLGDFNGDGLVDLISNNQGTYGIYYSTGAGFSYSSVGNLPFNLDVIWVGDFNGDNISDIFDANIRSIFTNTISTNPGQDYNQLPNLLSAVDNNIGSKIQIKYQPITNSSVYTETVKTNNPGVGLFNKFNSVPLSNTQGSAYPVRLTQSAMYVASAYSETDGRGHLYPYQYKYSNARVDMQGIGWLGFQSILETDSLAQNITTNNYYQIYPLTGKTAAAIKTDLNHRILDVQRYRYTIGYSQNIPYSVVYQVTQPYVATDHYDYGVFSYTSVINQQFDGFGNTKYAAVMGDTTLPQNTLYTLNYYTNDTTQQWLVGTLNKTIQSKDAAGDSILTQTTYSYYPNTNNLQNTSRWLNTTNGWLTTVYGYDGFGNRIWTADVAGDTSFVYYDSLYHSFPVLQVSPPNQWGKKLQNEVAYNPAFGTVNKAWDANGNVFEIVSDQFGRDSLFIGPDSTGAPTVLSKIYYIRGDSAGYIALRLSTNDWQGAIWDSTATYYDGLSRNYLNAWEAANGQTIWQQTVFNNLDKPTQYSIPYFSNAQPVWNTLSYDPYGRVITAVYPGVGQKPVTTKISYSGKQMLVQEAVGTRDSVNSAYYYEWYNSGKKIVKTVNKLGQTASFQYDLLGRNFATTDPGGLKTTTTYNSISFPVATSDPASGNSTYLYDFVGRKSATINNNRDTFWTLTDRLKRPIYNYIQGGNSYQFQYDLPGSRNGLGELCKIIMPDTGFYYIYQFTPYHQASSILMCYKAKSYTESLVYNPDQSVDQMVYPDSSVVQYAYYGNGLVKSIGFYDAATPGAGFSPVADFQTYDAASNLLLAQFGNKVTQKDAFYVSGHLKTHQIKDAQGNNLILQAYGWNPVNEIIFIADSLQPNYSQAFTYDKTGRLKTARGAYGKSAFSYNPSGNMLTKDGVTFTYNNYQVVSGTKNGATVFTAQYDNLGNLKNRLYIQGKDSSSLEYDYDPFNRLRSILKQGDTLFRFEYDYSGRRIEKTDIKNHLSTLYISPNYEITATPDSVLYTRYVASPNSIVASFTRAVARNANNSPKQYFGVPGSGTLYFHQNFVNSTSLATDSKGALHTQVYYRPFGEQFKVKGPENFRYSFGSKELDESGLYYFNARYYDPVTAHFITADDQPAGDMYRTDVFNRYAYTVNNPVKYSDPSGHALLTDMQIRKVLAIELTADLFTGGLITDAEVEVDAAFFYGIRRSRREFESTMGETGLSEEQAVQAYKGKRSAKAGNSAILNNNNNNNGLIDRHGNRVFENHEPDNLNKELGVLRKMKENLDYKFSESFANETGRIIGLLESGRKFKFTVSFEDYSLKILDPNIWDIKHPAVEGRGGRVFTAGYVRYNANKGVLTVDNFSGHYRPSANSLRMSDPLWRSLGLNGNNLIRVKYKEFFGD